MCSSIRSLTDVLWELPYVLIFVAPPTFFAFLLFRFQQGDSNNKLTTFCFGLSAIIHAVLAIVLLYLFTMIPLLERHGMNNAIAFLITLSFTNIYLLISMVILRRYTLNLLSSTDGNRA